MASTQTRQSSTDVALPGSAGVTVGRGNLRGMMAVDMCETDNEYSLFMDMPGKQVCFTIDTSPYLTAHLS
jgi:HSP20 family molecular chaperone IbpA